MSKPSVTIFWWGDLPTPNFEPWKFFHETLAKSFYINVDVDKAADFVICFNFTEKMRKYITEYNIPLSRRILIVIEPRIVCPLNHIASTRALFSHIFVASPNWKIHSSERVFNPPQRINLDQARRFTHSNVDRGSTPVIINANKISFIQGEMYSLRRQVAQKFPVKLFGKNWDRHNKFKFFILSVRNIISQSIYLKQKLFSFKVIIQNVFTYFLPPLNYCGMLEDKSILRTTDFAIVIENELSYVTEKLFDVLCAGCIPIYIGPNLKEFSLDLPSELICDPSIQEIKKKLKFVYQLSDEEKLLLRLKIFRLLEVNYELWNEDSVINLLLRDITEIITLS